MWQSGFNGVMLDIYQNETPNRFSSKKRKGKENENIEIICLIDIHCW